MFVRNISRREKIIGCITLVIAFIFVGNYLINKPVVKKWASLDQQIIRKENMLKRNTELAGRYKALKKDALSIGKTPSEKEPVSVLLGKIEDAAESNSCHIIKIKPYNYKDAEDYKEVFFEITSEGTIGGLSRFLYDIESIEGYSNIERFTMMSRSEQAGRLKAVFILHSKAFESDVRLLMADKSRPLEDYSVYSEKISGKDLFAVSAVKQAENPNPSLEIDPLKRFTLVGIITEGEGQAVIEDIEAQKTYYLSEGQSVNDAVVKEIREKEVVLDYKGKDILLIL